MQRLREAAEQAKKELSSSTSTNISLQYLSMTENGPVHLDEKLTRAQFEQMTADLLDRTKAPFHAVIRDAGIKLSRDRPHRARRRLHPDARGRRGRPRADRRQGAQQGRQPGRGRRRRCRAAGRRPQGRAQGRPAHRRHPAEPRHRDQGRDHDQADRAQHGHPDQGGPRSSPTADDNQPSRAHPGVPGRARVRAGQQAARHVRAHRHRAGAAWGAAGRGHVRHRRERHRARVRQGPRHRQGAVDDDHRRLARCPRRTSTGWSREAEEHAGRGQASAARRPRPATRPSSWSTRPRSSSPTTPTSSPTTSRPRSASAIDELKTALDGRRRRGRSRPSTTTLPTVARSSARPSTRARQAAAAETAQAAGERGAAPSTGVRRGRRRRRDRRRGRS